MTDISYCIIFIQGNWLISPVPWRNHIWSLAKLIIVFLGGYFHGLHSLTYGVDILRVRWMGVLQVGHPSLSFITSHIQSFYFKLELNHISYVSSSDQNSSAMHRLKPPFWFLWMSEIKTKLMKIDFFNDKFTNKSCRSKDANVRTPYHPLDLSEVIYSTEVLLCSCRELQ